MDVCVVCRLSVQKVELPCRDHFTPEAVFRRFRTTSLLQDLNPSLLPLVRC